MPFKKLHPDIQTRLEALEMTIPTPFQCQAIPVIKSGANVYCTAAKGSGKTTTIILTTLQKLKCRAFGNAPRAIIVVENKEIALELYATFLEFTKTNSIRVYVGYEDLHVDIQKSEIAMGIDILISTPKSLNQLFLLNGLNTAELKIFSVDDAEFLEQKSAYNAIMSVTRSIKKCQYVIYSQKLNPMLKRFEAYFMEFSKKVKVES